MIDDEDTFSQNPWRGEYGGSGSRRKGHNCKTKEMIQRNLFTTTLRLGVCMQDSMWWCHCITFFWYERKSSRLRDRVEM